MQQWREAPDEDRDLLLARDVMLCSQCGNLREECSNPDIDWHTHKSVCFASASLEWGREQFLEKHKGAKTPDNALGPLHGVALFAAPMEPAPEDDPLR